MPVGVTVRADRAVLTAGAVAQVTLRVDAAGYSHADTLPPVDVTLTLPDGLATTDGRSGVLAWSGVAISPGAAFTQTLGVRPAGSIAGQGRAGSRRETSPASRSALR